MTPHPFGVGGVVRQVMSTLHAMVVQLIFERTVLLLAVMFCLGVTATLWHLSHLSANLAEFGALQGTSLYSESLTELRTFYGSQVVDRVRPQGVMVTHDYGSHEGAIPIPATFSIEFGKHIGEKNPGMQIRLYSEHPFPFRKDGGPRDAFEWEALRELRKNPGKPFFRFEEFRGRPSLRYATAVQMKAGCVTCHNSHPESPKTDWTAGDVRGIQEIIQPLDGTAAQTQEGLKDTFVLLTTMGLLGLGGLGLVIGRMRRTSRELEQRVAERTAAEARLAALHEINLAATSTLDLGTVLKVLLENIDFFLPYSAATLRLLNKDTGLLEPLACRNLDEEEWKSERWKGGRGVADVVFENKAPLIIKNVQKDPRVRDPEFFRKHGLVAYLGVPLTVKDEIFGVLAFYTKEERIFSEREVEFLTTLSGQAAIAIHNAQLHQQTRYQAVELEEANKVKDEFLRVMSHELRTPLNVIMGYTEMVKDHLLGETTSEQQNALEKVAGHTKDLLTMVNGILQVTTIEAQKVKVENHEFDLGDFFDTLRSGYEIPTGKPITFHWDYPANLPVVVSDDQKLKHIFQNLINNAIKFTDKGQIRVSAKIRSGNGHQAGNGHGHSAGNGHSAGEDQRTKSGEQIIEFRVTDTGIGIPKQKIPVIFEMFRQGDSSETRLHGGVGLGLYIAKNFTQLLDGSIEVETEERKGSTFIVSIPCTISSRAAQPDVRS